MNAQEIINEIANLVTRHRRPYWQWTVGVTDNPDRRYSDHRQDGRDVSLWDEWDADTEQGARDVEQHFIRKGMQGGGGGAGSADYVYVF